jgi:hypothetical protein
MSDLSESEDLSLEDVLSAWHDSQQDELHTALPGRVVSYDDAAQVADVAPLINRSLPRSDGSRASEALPTIRAVPVMFPSSGDFYVRFPVAAGDEGLLLICERDPARWRVTGQISDPIDVRTHHLAHAVFYPGLRSRPKALPASTGQYVELGKTTGTPDFVTLANKVKTALDDIRTAYNTHTHTGVQTGTGSSGPPAVTFTGGVDPASLAAEDVKAT